MIVYQLNRELAHLLLERPSMADEIERQGGLKDSYTKQELLFMLFPKEINDLIDRGALIGPHVEKQEPAIENGGSPQNVVERRKILQRAIYCKEL